MLFSLILLACFPEISKIEEERFPENPNHDYDEDGISDAEDCDDANSDIGRPLTYYADSDGDGFPNEAESEVSCPADKTDGYILPREINGIEVFDCDDTDVTLTPEDYDQDGASSCDGDCDDRNNQILEPINFYLDADGDGFGFESVSELVCPADKPDGYIEAKERDGLVVFDCDDDNPAVNPDEMEICDEVDNDCNGRIDEIDGQMLFRWYIDSDGDGFGIYQDDESIVYSCTQTPGLSSNFLDCDDTNAAISPNAIEVCDDVDNNCDTVVDERSAADALLWLQDADVDGYGSNFVTLRACEQPLGYVAEADGGDCNDVDALIHPNASEACNSADDDCDGLVDEGADSTAPIGSVTFYADLDGDGYGDPNSMLVQCNVSIGFVSNSDDCDDGNSNVYPGATEYCNGDDDDCDGELDEASAVDKVSYYADTDGDGFGDGSDVAFACPLNQPLGYVSDSSDCNDSDGAIFPNAMELCNQLDDDCDGGIDEGVDFSAPSNAVEWFYDIDGDGFGDQNNAILACNAPVNTVANSDDCNDLSVSARPGAAEYCNGLDDDCDGGIDEDALDMVGYYIDNDLDGHGDPSTGVMSCPDYSTGDPVVPAGASLNGDDCNDLDPEISPSATELCTPTVDENCDGDPTYGVLPNDLPSWYPDSDGDGYGNPTFVIQLCQQPLNYVPNSDDCNDTDYFVHPLDQTVHSNDFEADGVTPFVHRERCNGKVDICENDTLGNLTPPNDERDLDGDSFVECLLDVDVLQWADQSIGILGGADCDDTDSLVYPGALERCNGIFDNCTHYQVDEYSAPLQELDNDQDNFVECTGFDIQTWQGDVQVIGGGDCNDVSAQTYPGAAYNTDPTACLTDLDLDGFVDRSWGVCAVNYGLEDGQQRIYSNTEFENLGRNVVSAGDVDGDGLDDVMLFGSTNTVYLFLGSSLSTTGDFDVSSADYTFLGGSNDPSLSGSMGAAGDVDGDGLGDILISTGTFRNGGFYAGKVYLVFGSSLGTATTMSLDDADVHILGEEELDYFGISVSSAGDVDGDGLSDILVGAFGNNEVGSSAGKSYLFFGSEITPGVSISASEADYMFTGTQSGDQSGIWVQGDGDMDGDGLDDIFIGAQGQNSGTGAGYVVFASSLGTDSVVSLSNADIVITGTGVGHNFGGRGFMLSDWDGDGLSELVVSERYYGGNNGRKGRVYVFLSSVVGAIGASAADYIFEGAVDFDYFGGGLSVGDMDGDGLTDLLVGASGNDDSVNSGGKSYLFFASNLTGPGFYSASSADHTVVGNSAFLATGDVLSAAGDLNGDGMNEIIVGSMYSNFGGSSTGLVSIFTACDN